MVLTQDVGLVVDEDVSGDHRLVSGQDDLLQEVMTQMLLYPGILDTHTHTWDLIRKRKQKWTRPHVDVQGGGGGVYLLVRAVSVMFYGAGANKDIRAADRKKGKTYVMILFLQTDR